MKRDGHTRVENRPSPTARSSALADTDRQEAPRFRCGADTRTAGAGRPPERVVGISRRRVRAPIAAPAAAAVPARNRPARPAPRVRSRPTPRRPAAAQQHRDDASAAGRSLDGAVIAIDVHDRRFLSVGPAGLTPCRPPANARRRPPTATLISRRQHRQQAGGRRRPRPVDSGPSTTSRSELTTITTRPLGSAGPGPG